MEVKHLAGITTLENILKHRQTLIERQNLGYSADHSLFDKGFLIGVEAALLALAEDIAGRPKLDLKS